MATLTCSECADTVEVNNLQRDIDLREVGWIRLYPGEFYCGRCSPTVLASAIRELSNRIDCLEGQDD